MGLINSSGVNSNPSTATQTTVSPYAAGYVNNLLSQGQALANAPMPAYTGQLTAGASDLQNQAFQGLANLTLPSDLTSAGTALGDTATQAANIGSSFTPTDFTNTYTSPGAYQGTTATNQFQAPTGQANVNYTNQFQAPGAYNAIQATNQYQGTGPYQGTQASTQNFDTTAANQYMNPYLSASLAPQLQLLQQQLGAQNAQTNAQLAQAGAYGGGRQAVANSQNALNSNLAANQLISQGYNTAYNNAQQAFTADQARQLQAQQANINQQQFGANLGLSNAQNAANYGQQAQAANIQQQQFGAQQGMTAAEQAAQYGQSALAAQGQQQQFNLGQQMTAAQQAANYGQAAQAANIQQQQFGAQTGLTEAQQQAQSLQAQQAAQEAAKQYQSTLGLSGLQAATTAEQAQANAGTNEAQYGLQNLNALSAAGATQQALNQAGLTAQYNQYLNQLAYPQQMLKLQSSLLSGLPISTTNTYGAQPSVLQNLVGTSGGVASLVKNLGSAGLNSDSINKFLKSIGVGSSSGTATPIDTSQGVDVGGVVKPYTEEAPKGPNGTAGLGQVLGTDGKIYKDPTYEADIKSIAPPGVTIDPDTGMGSDGVDYSGFLDGP